MATLPLVVCVPGMNVQLQFRQKTEQLAWFPGSHTWPGNQVNTHLAEDMHGISKVLVVYTQLANHWLQPNLMSNFSFLLQLLLQTLYFQFLIDTAPPRCDQLWEKNNLLQLKSQELYGKVLYCWINPWHSWGHGPCTVGGVAHAQLVSTNQ